MWLEYGTTAVYLELHETPKLGVHQTGSSSIVADCRTRVPCLFPKLIYLVLMGSHFARSGAVRGSSELSRRNVEHQNA